AFPLPCTKSANRSGTSTQPATDSLSFESRHFMSTKLIALKTKTPWWRLDAGPDVADGLDASELLAMLEQLILIRRFEERLLTLSVAGILHGPAHSSIGQEGAAVGAMSVLGSADK